jgi:hypothetical protein
LHCPFTQITVLPELPAGLQYLWCTDTPLILQRNDGESIADYNLRWDEWRSKQRIHATTRLLKEDLIAATWHPDRFEQWCLDTEEKKENEMMMA